MYPKDNIFTIYYNIGRRVPFQVKRCEVGLKRSLFENRYKPTGRTFMVEKVEPKGKYGKAYGYCLVNNVRDDEYLKMYNPNYSIDDIAEIPCAGCGEWVLIDVPGHSLDEIFPIHKADEILPFGQYKGMTYRDVYLKDAKYIYWLIENDPNFKVDILEILGVIPKNDSEAKKLLSEEYDRVFSQMAENVIMPFGKYKGKSLKEIEEQDPNYIDWLRKNNIDILGRK